VLLRGDAAVAQVTDTGRADQGQSIGGAGVQFPGSDVGFHVRISGAHALRLIYLAGKEG